MSKTVTLRFLAAALVAVCVSTITQLPAGADELAARFQKPPDEARPLTWWHWLDGNITREGITADWEAIQRAGLGGAYLFNCGVGMPQGDRAFCAGVNQFVFHTFAHQPYRATGPGFTFASWGLNFNRANTWWDAGRAWMDYLTRCNYLLREGRSVADVLFFVGEDVPNRIAWRDELRPSLPAGYDFDGCDAQALREARVEKGRLMLPSGTEYRVLLLPNLATMRPEVLQKIGELAAAGATVLGPRPQQSPSLRDIGKGDQIVRKLAEELWNGRVFSGLSFEELFERIGLPPDFEWRTTTPDADVLYVHRRVGEAEVYFLSNQKNRCEDVAATFRVSDRAPELFDPATGTVTRPGVFRSERGRLTLPLRMEPSGSVFIVFREPLPDRHAVVLAAQPPGTTPSSPAFEVERTAAGQGRRPHRRPDA